MKKEQVAVYKQQNTSYPNDPPFNPSNRYPEYQYQEIGKDNNVYEGVRELFHLLNLDSANYNSSLWNPLGSIVSPGNKVVLKPNFLSQSHKFRPNEWLQVVTHGSIIRAVVDYVLIALKEYGEIVILDGPQYDSDWDSIISRTGINDVVKFLSTKTQVPINILDIRDERFNLVDDVVINRVKLPGDPQGGYTVNLAEKSRFVDHPEREGIYYGADYDRSETNYHHSKGKHEYRISMTAAAADVFINLPKMKTHKKVGVTLSLKNLVGINNGRNWLPHHAIGTPKMGGDQFPDTKKFTKTEIMGVLFLQKLTQKWPEIFAPLFRLSKMMFVPVFGKTDKVIRSGNWHGNDTCWRMVHDINRVLNYSNGTVFPNYPCKKNLSIIDGIIGGEGDGPSAPEPKPAGLLIGGINSVAVDCVGAKMMGFDPLRIPMLYEAFNTHQLPLVDFSYDEIQIISNDQNLKHKLVEISKDLSENFKPHFGWEGFIE